MLVAGSAFIGCETDAQDGPIGTVSDFLFDETSWQIRWMVVRTGSWLNARKVLLHPSAIIRTDYALQIVSVDLLKAVVAGSPDISSDAPVSRQMEDQVYDYYGWDPSWSGGNFFSGYSASMSPLLARSPAYGAATLLHRSRAIGHRDSGDPHLRSMQAVKHYHIAAADGAVGHLENFLVDNVTWGMAYLIVDTRDWLPGRHVLLSPFAVADIDWSLREVTVTATRKQVEDSPLWDPAKDIDEAYQRDLHSAFGWPGYGW